MKIVNIIGGLGNQMFQYAFALALQHKHRDQKVKIDVSHFNYIFLRKFGASNLHNGYEIDKIFPKATLERATCIDLVKITWYMPNYFFSRVIRKLLWRRPNEYVQRPNDIFKYDSCAFNSVGPGYYEGVWQSVQYYEDIKDVLFDTFAHPVPDEYNRAIISEISKSHSTGIHIRRGDYLLTKDFSGICTVEYYRKAIEEVLKDGKQHTFYIFSNDILWCKQNIAPLLGECKVIYVTHNKGENSYWDMFLMTYCKNLILANSTFSWWGAFLNKVAEKVVVPEPWLNREGIIDNCPKEWIKINVRSGIC